MKLFAWVSLLSSWSEYLPWRLLVLRYCLGSFSFLYSWYFLFSSKKMSKTQANKKKASQPWPPSPTNTLKGFNENNIWQLCLSDQCGMGCDIRAETKCINVCRTQYYSWNKRFRCLFFLTHCIVRSQTELKMQLEEWKCLGWCKLVLTPSVFQDK